MSKEEAIKVLQEVKSARETLEHNILHVCRRHEQRDLFNYFDPKLQVGEEGNIIRIKKQVSDKIKQINDEIQTEIYTKKTPCKGNATKGDRKVGRLPLHQVNRRIVPPPKIVKPTKTKVKKVKQKEPKKPDPPPKSSTAYDELIIQHIYGRQPHQSHRHTTKNEKNSFCSPHRHVLPKNKATCLPDFTEPSVPPNVIPIKPNNDYCIHLQAYTINNVTSIEHNFPNAIALVEPSRSLSGRLPLPLSTKENKLPESVSPKVVRKKCQLSKAGPNVAVINIKSDDFAGSSSVRNHIKSKVRDRVRSRMKLRIQPLPNVDIDTTDPSSTMSTSYSSNNSITQNSSLNDVTKGNVNENPYDFQDFISVQDISKVQSDNPMILQNETGDNTKSEESYQQPQIYLSGCKPPEQYNYSGPVFPPKNVQVTDAIEQAPVTTVTVEQTLEQNALDWIEQECLARLISQMADLQNKPSINEFSDNVCLQSLPEEDHSSHDWLDNVIGLDGLQIFINAGIPVNKDLVKDLIRTVLLERLETLFGYPKPSKKAESPVIEMQPEPKLSTPVRTPSPSFIIEEKVDNETPNRTISDLTEQSIDNDVGEISSVHEEINYEIVTTPQLSFVEEDKEGASHHFVATPEGTLVDDFEFDPVQNFDLKTPEHSVKSERAQVTMDNFEFSESIASPISTITNDNTLSKEELETTPPPPVIQVSEASVTTSPTVVPSAMFTVSTAPIKTLSVTRSPSIPSTTFTASSSVVGLSSFNEISIGEHLNPEHAVSDGSEGELGLPRRGMEILQLMKDRSDSFPSKTKPVSQFFPDLFPKHLFPPQLSQSLEKHTYTKNDVLSEGEILGKDWHQLKSVGEVSIIDADNTEVDTEDLSDNTLEEISKALNDENDPMIKLLNKIKAPKRGSLTIKSEGEVSVQSNLDNIQEIPDVCSGENSSQGSLSLGMLNQESDSSIQEESNLTPLSATQGRLITVKPVDDVVNDNKILISEGEILNTDNNQLDVCKSEGELVNTDLDPNKLLNCDLDIEQSLSEHKSKTNNDKVVMVLRLPEVDDDDQNLSYDDLFSQDDISTISGGEF